MNVCVPARRREVPRDADGAALLHLDRSGAGARRETAHRPSRPRRRGRRRCDPAESPGTRTCSRPPRSGRRSAPRPLSDRSGRSSRRDVEAIGRSTTSPRRCRRRRRSARQRAGPERELRVNRVTRRVWGATAPGPRVNRRGVECAHGSADMACSIRRIDYFRTTISDEPGERFTALSTRHRRGVNLLAFTGSRSAIANGAHPRPRDRVGVRPGRHGGRHAARGPAPGAARTRRRRARGRFRGDSSRARARAVERDVGHRCRRRSRLVRLRHSHAFGRGGSAADVLGAFSAGR